jgi:GntR family transcriptional regulator
MYVLGGITSVQIVLDPDSPVPLYYQLQQHLRRQIETGTLQTGDVLPAEENLAADLGISRATVRQAIAGLVQEGRLERRRNRGTRVTAPPVRQSLEGFYSFAHAMAERGIEQHSRIIALRCDAASVDVSTVLGRQEAGVVFLQRLRYAGDMSLIIETCWYPKDVGDLLLSADLTTASIYDLLEAAGVIISRASEFIRPVVLDGAQADLLGVNKGDPALFVERTSFAESRPVELRRSVIRGDRYLYSVDLPRAAQALRDRQREARA